MKKDGVLAVWKPIGESTHELARKISEKYGVKVSHTGTLDPVAEGVVIILLGETRYKKYEYAKWEKEYEFEIVFGVSTDTLDGLGIVDGTILDVEIKEYELKKVLESFVGKYTQIVPAYSAIKIKGRPLHWYARNSKLNEIELPTRSGEIFSIKLMGFEKKKLAAVSSKAISNVKKVIHGDLRQEEIIKNWKDKKGSDVFTAKIKVRMTKGLYVRSLAKDIGDKFNAPAFVSSLVRTKNGEYSKKECILNNF